MCVSCVVLVEPGRRLALAADRAPDLVGRCILATLLNHDGRQLITDQHTGLRVEEGGLEMIALTRRHLVQAGVALVVVPVVACVVGVPTGVAVLVVAGATGAGVVEDLSAIAVRSKVEGTRGG